MHHVYSPLETIQEGCLHFSSLRQEMEYKGNKGHEPIKRKISVGITPITKKKH